MSEDVKKKVEFKLKKSDETLEEAKLLADGAYWNGAVNRLYYAAFYAVSAWLHQNNVITKTHNGTRNKFNELLIKATCCREDVVISIPTFLATGRTATMRILWFLTKKK